MADQTDHSPGGGEADGPVAIIAAGAPDLTLAHVRALTGAGWAVLVAGADAQIAALPIDLAAGDGSALIATAAGDVGDEADWMRWGAEASRRGRLGLLVTLESPTGAPSLLDLTRDQWRRAVDTSVRAAFLGMKIVAPILRDGGGGAVVHVTTSAGVESEADPIRTATAWAVRGLAKTAAQELGPWGVRVSSVHHGVILDADDPSSASSRARRDLVPMRSAGSARDVAELVAYLGSDSGRFITGAEIAVDGGWTSGVHARQARHPR